MQAMIFCRLVLPFPFTFILFLVPGFLLSQFIPKKSTFFWCVLQTRGKGENIGSQNVEVVLQCWDGLKADIVQVVLMSIHGRYGTSNCYCYP